MPADIRKPKARALVLARSLLGNIDASSVRALRELAIAGSSATAKKTLEELEAKAAAVRVEMAAIDAAVDESEIAAATQRVRGAFNDRKRWP